MAQLEIRLLDQFGNETQYPGYARGHFNQGDFDEHRCADAVKYTNRREIMFPECTGGSWAITYLSLYFGTWELARCRVDNPVHLTACVRLSFPPGMLRVTIPGTRVQLTPEETRLVEYLDGHGRETCTVCEGSWSLLRDPCPGCGAVRVAS